MKSIEWYKIVIAIPVSIIGIYLGITLKGFRNITFYNENCRIYPYKIYKH